MMKVVPVRIGSKYQADLPELLSPDQSGQSVANATASAGDDAPAPPLPSVPVPAAALSPPPRYKQRWTPSRFTSEEVTEFLRSACRLNEVEMGLQCLFESDFQVPTAVELLVAARRRKVRKQRAEDEHLSDAAFGSAVGTHGKKFFLIQQQLEHVTTGDVIRRFYLWKTSAAYARWRERIKARRNKESARLRVWGDLEDSETSDFHNEYCELCFTGGQLLCCDGCERAYHFSCVTPPINEIPNGDWFCSHCSNILETSLSVKQSDENEHCDEVVVDESVGEASDVETLDLEDIDDDEDDETLSAVGTTSSRTKDAQSGSFGSGRPSPMRTASSTDNDESDSGFKSASASSDGRFSSLTIKQENISSADAGEANFKMKKEPPHFSTSASGKAPTSQQQRRATELRKFVSPAKTALVLEPSSSERKRKRKIEAPRRIPQQRSNF